MYEYIIIGSFAILTPITFIIIKKYFKKTEKKVTTSPSPKRRRETIILPPADPFNLDICSVDQEP